MKTPATLATPMIQIRLPQPVGAVVLDMDGTVLDTERVYVETFFETVAPFGYTLSRAFLHSLVGGTREQFQAGLRSQLGEDFPYDDHRRAYHHCSSSPPMRDRASASARSSSTATCRPPMQWR